MIWKSAMGLLQAHHNRQNLAAAPQIQNQRFAVQTIAGAVSSVWIVIAAAIRIGVAVVARLRASVSRLLISISRPVGSVPRPVVTRPNGGCRSRSTHDAKADCSSRVAATVITAE